MILYYFSEPKFKTDRQRICAIWGSESLDAEPLECMGPKFITIAEHHTTSCL